MVCLSGTISPSASGSAEENLKFGLVPENVWSKSTFSKNKMLFGNKTNSSAHCILFGGDSTLLLAADQMLSAFTLSVVGSKLRTTPNYND